MDHEPGLRHVSDHSLLVSLAEEVSHAAHRRVVAAFRALQEPALPGVRDLHPAYSSLLVSYDPRRADRDGLCEAVAERLRALRDAVPPAVRTVEIPVAYGGADGPDLTDVARASGLAESEVAAVHASGDYFVCFLGFSPGFPYLGGMPPALAVPRRATPRTRVPAGSVAIAGTQAGIYPLASPGGWQLIGRTPVRLFDPLRTPPALLAIGDRVRFVPISATVTGDRGGARRAAAAEPRRGPIRIVDGGLQSTVQDPGRPGHAHIGVSACGAADPLALAVGNWLVGNPEDAPAVEMTLLGGTLVFEAEATIAVTGSDFSPRLDGAALPLWTGVEVAAGQTLALGPTRGGARCTVCVRGGIGGARVLGSASTHVTSGLGGLDGRALRRGDVLPAGEPAASPGRGRTFDPAVASRLQERNRIRVTAGAQWDLFTSAARSALFAAPYRVSEDSSRMGLRLAGAALSARRQGEMITEGVSLGALQVPGDGQPIISFVEHQTTGGYPQIACVIAADLHRLGQLRPRDEVRFTRVSLAEADAALRAADGAATAGRIGE